MWSEFSPVSWDAVPKCFSPKQKHSFSFGFRWRWSECVKSAIPVDSLVLWWAWRPEAEAGTHWQEQQASAFGRRGPVPLRTPPAAQPALQKHSRVGSIIEVVVTPVINVSLQLCLRSMNAESSADHHYVAGPWFTYSRSALGYSEAILCAAHLCGPNHFLLCFAFTLSIGYGWWQRRIHLYL